MTEQNRGSGHALLPPLAIAALAVFSEGESHPYEVFSTMRKRREDRVVKLNPGTLYRQITKLAADGFLAEGDTTREGNRPERTTYTITDAGREQLVGQLRTMIAQPVYEFPAFPGAAGALHHLDRDDAIGQLTKRIAVLSEELTVMDAAATLLLEGNLPRRFWLDLDYLRSQYRAEETWCRATADAIADGSIDWYSDPGCADPRIQRNNMIASPLHPMTDEPEADDASSSSADPNSSKDPR